MLLGSRKESKSRRLVPSTEEVYSQRGVEGDEGLRGKKGQKRRGKLGALGAPR